jgi:hypothetical protein
MRRLRLLLLGAALAYFFDRENGATRRKAATKRLVELRSRQRPELDDELAGQARDAS